MKTKKPIKMIKPFNDRCIGALVKDDYWLCDGHIGVNTRYFEGLKIPKNCEYFLNNKIPFNYQNKSISTDSIPNIEAVIPNGPRYILVKTSLYHEGLDNRPTSIFYGHDRLVYIDKVFTDIIKQVPLNAMQNYDKPLGPVSFYHQKDDIETALPIAIISPLRAGWESESIIKSNVEDILQTINADKKAA